MNGSDEVTTPISDTIESCFRACCRKASNINASSVKPNARVCGRCFTATLTNLTPFAFAFAFDRESRLLRRPAVHL